MITEFLAYEDTLLVADVLADLREHSDRYSDYDVQYAYLTSVDRRLMGVLRLRDLLLSPPDRPVRSLMIAEPLHVRTETSVRKSCAACRRTAARSAAWRGCR